MTRKYLSIFLTLIIIVNIISANLFLTVQASDYIGSYDQSSNFGIANDFNLFILGDHEQSDVDSEGRVAVAGNVSYSNYAVGSKLAKSTTRADLIIGGDVNITSAHNHSGNTVISTSSKIINYGMSHSNGVSNPIREDVINFSSARDFLTNASQTWAKYPVNGTVKILYGQLILEGSSPALNVFSFDGSSIESDGTTYSLNSIHQINIVVPDNSTVIINIGGDNIGFGNYSIFFKGSTATTEHGQYFLWNFHEATSLWNNNITIKGSVLAPNADWISKGYGNVEGNFIVKSLRDGPGGGHLEAHNSLFKGTLPPLGANDAPTVPDYSVTTPEDTPVSGKVVGSDKDGDTLTYEKATDPTNGTVVVNADGTWTYTPNEDYTGTDSFTVEVSDGNGGTAISTITITVTPANDAPTVPDYSVTTPEDTPVSGTVVGADKDGDTLTYEKETDPTNGTVEVNTDGTWTYTPNTDFTGIDSFTVEVSDGNGGTEISTITITVTPANDAPTVPDYSVTTPEDTAVSGTVVGTDIDGDTLTYEKATDPANGTLEVNSDGSWTYTPNEDYTGTDGFTVEVSDGNGGTAISTITITVTPANDAPTVPDYSVTTPEDTAVSGTVVGADKDGDTLTYEKETDPANGTVVVNADGSWTYTPNEDYTGTDSFTVEVSDGNGGTTISTITITVTPANDAPTVPDYSVTTPEDTPVSGTVVGADKDGDTLTYEKETDPANGTVVVNADGTWTYTPNEDYTGIDSFTVEVSDGNGGTEISTITITVTPANDAPTVPDYSVTTPEDTPVSGKVVGSDKDGDTLTYKKIAEPTNGTVVDSVYGDWEYTPNLNFIGIDIFKVEVSDGNGGTAISTITITVTPANDPPTVPDYSVTTPENTPVSGKVVGIDVDGDMLTYSKASEPSNGKVVANADGTWIYTPNKSYTGTDSFTVEVSDGNGGTAISTITIKITPVKDTTPSPRPNTPSTPRDDNEDREVSEPELDIPGAPAVKADFAVLIDSSTMRAGENSNVEYTITYFNKLSTEISNTFVKVNVPDLMLFVEANENGELVGNEVIWEIGNLKGNTKGTVKFTLKVKELDVQESVVALKANIYTKYENVELINPNDDESKIDTFLFANSSEFIHTRYILGYPDGTVKPKGAVTRAEVAVIFARILKLKEQGYVKGVKVFSDVNVNFWAVEHIEAVTTIGLFKGYQDGTFRPNQPITRAELATVISKYLKITTYPEYNVLAKYFTDISGHWAEAIITEIYRYDIIKGYEDGTFRPDNTITREETITMVNQMLHRGPLMNVEPSFPDNLKTNWSFGHVEEATNTHKSYYNEDGSETLVQIIPEGIW